MLVVEPDGAVVVVTLDRPASRNALNAELRAALWRTMSELDADPGVRCVVLTGADPAFCAGLDLKELADDPSALAASPSDAAAGAGLRRPIPTMHTPVIGAINGVAITGGFELALACDFLVASEHARFADTHARVGIMPGWGLTVALPEAVGLRRARELSATGNFCDAATALDWGLVNHVVPHAELLPTAVRLARDVAEVDPAAVAHVLGTYEMGASLSRDEALALERARSGEWLAARDPSDLESRRLDVTRRGRSQT